MSIPETLSKWTEFYATETDSLKELAETLQREYKSDSLVNILQLTKYKDVINEKIFKTYKMFKPINIVSIE